MKDLETRAPQARVWSIAALLAWAAVATALIAVVAGCGPSPATPATTIGPGGATPSASELLLVTIQPIETAPAATAAAAASATTAATGVRADRIRIERLGIDLRIIEGDGIDAPIGKAAHYPGTAWPGSGSNIYIYGHAREGMFIALWDVRKGDEIELRLVDGTSRTYVVTRIMPRIPWDAVEYLDPTETEQLTLQTSTSYEPTAPRFIAIAVPKS